MGKSVFNFDSLSFFLKGPDITRIDRDFDTFIRCGRVMADNIAYARFRKTLLI